MSRQPERVLVTGATGLLGHHLVPALLAQGDAVRVLQRGPAAPASPGVEVLRGDLGDPAVRAAAVRGVDAVYHLAAVTAKWLPDRRPFHAINVEGSVDLAQRAADAGARVVHVSSFTVFGPSPPGQAVDETTELEPARLQNDYQRSKALAHLRLLGLARDQRLPVTIVCPGVLFGCGPAALRNPVVELMRDQLCGRLRRFPGGGRRTWPFAWLPDVANGLLRARERTAPGDVFLLGGECRPLLDVFGFVERHGGPPAPRSVPLLPVLAAGSVLQLLARCFNRTPRLTAASLRFLLADWRCSSARATNQLAYRPTPFADSLLAVWSDLHAKRLVPEPPPAAVPAA